MGVTTLSSDLIPDGWRASLLSEHLKEPIRNGFSPVCPEHFTGEWILSLASVGDSGYNPLRAKPAPLGDARVKASRLIAGDLVVSRSNTPDRVGLAGIYNGDPSPASYPDLLMRVRVSPSIDGGLLLQQMLSQRGRNYFASSARGSSGSMVKIDRAILEAFPVLAPCDRKEQRAIASALSDAGTLIDSLEQLLTKKRQIKQGAMQELLTGNRRLPGFSRPWRSVRAHQLGAFLKGAGVKRDEASTGELPCVRYGEIYTEHCDFIRAFRSWISPAVAAYATKLQRGDLLFAGSGETKEEIGKCVAFLDEFVAYAGGDIVILRPCGEVNSMFMGYLLNTPAVVRQKASKGQGDAVVHISAAALGQICVELPCPGEQAAIAQVLFDLDAGISAIESRLTKARALKQAMAQALLTGRIRLVKSAA